MTPEWYQQGNWPLIGAIAVLVVTNVIGMWKIYLQAQASVKTQLKMARIETLSKQLTDFYNPLYTLLHLNQEAFESVGPNTFPTDPMRRDAAGEVWSRIREKVVVPNNTHMQEILRDKSHLISAEDNLAAYFPLQNHLAMYEVFLENPTEIYDGFRYPPAILNHVENQRDSLLKVLKELREG